MAAKSQKEEKGVEVAQYSGANHSPLHCATCESKTGEGNEEDMMIILPHIYIWPCKITFQEKRIRTEISEGRNTQGQGGSRSISSSPLCEL